MILVCPRNGYKGGCDFEIAIVLHPDISSTIVVKLIKQDNKRERERSANNDDNNNNTFVPGFFRGKHLVVRYIKIYLKYKGIFLHRLYLNTSKTGRKSQLKNT